MLSLRLLKEYFQKKSSYSLQELTELLQEKPTTVQFMLQHFLKRGLVIEYNCNAGCGGSCQKCPFAATTIYQWKKNSTTQPTID